MPNRRLLLKKLLSTRIILGYILPLLLLLTGAGFGIHEYLNYRHTQEEKQYLTIKEWGVRFKLPESLRGDINREKVLVYPASGAYPGWEEINFSAMTPSKMYKRCEPGDKAVVGTGVSVTRHRVSDRRQESENYKHIEPVATIGDYDYTLSPAYMNDTCFVDEQTAASVIKKRELLFNAAKYLETVKN